MNKCHQTELTPGISVQDYNTRYRGLPSHLVLYPQRTTSQGAVRCEQCLSITLSAGILKHGHIPCLLYVCAHVLTSYSSQCTQHCGMCASIMLSNNSGAHNVRDVAHQCQNSCFLICIIKCFGLCANVGVMFERSYYTCERIIICTNSMGAEQVQLGRITLTGDVTLCSIQHLHT